MMSRMTEKTDQMLIDSKTQRLTILEEEYQMKEIALEKATDLIALLSDELENVKQSSFEIIEELKFKLEQYEHKNNLLQNKLRDLEDFISQKQSRVSGVPPSSRRSFSQKKNIKDKRKQQQVYLALHSKFLRSLTSTLLSKMFQTHKQVEYMLRMQTDQIKELEERMNQYKVQLDEIKEYSYEQAIMTKNQLFGIVSEQQFIITNLRKHITELQSGILNIASEKTETNQQYLAALINQLKTLLGIVTKCIKTKSAVTKSTDARSSKRNRQIETPYEYVSKMESLLSRERSLTNQNRELKNIVEGLISHFKK